MVYCFHTSYSACGLVTRVWKIPASEELTFSIDRYGEEGEREGEGEESERRDGESLCDAEEGKVLVTGECVALDKTIKPDSIKW